MTMTSTPTPPRQTVVPSHRLPRGAGGRPWRVILILIAAAMLVVGAGAVAASAVRAAVDRASFSAIPAVQEIGTPAALTVVSSVADVTIQPDASVDQVTLRLVDGAGSADGTARARVTTREVDGRTVVSVDRPAVARPWSWDDGRDLELLIPADLSPTLDLAVQAGIGDIDITGSYGALSVTGDIGDVSLTGVDVPGAIAVTTSIGDVRLELPASATPTGIDVRSDNGDVSVAVPGSAVYQVQATTDLGTATVDPGIAAPDGPALTAYSSLGDVRVTR